MGKNQAYKAMQRAKHAASSDAHFEADDGTIDASFHTPQWHAARVAALQVERMPWEEWKRKVREEEESRGKLEEDEERVMREYRAQLDADREKRMGKSGTHQQSTSDGKSKKRKRSDRDKEKKKSKKHKRDKDKKRKKKKNRRKHSRSPPSSSSASSHSDSREEGGPVRLSEFLKK